MRERAASSRISAMTEGVQRRVVACERRVDNGGVFVRRGVESRRIVLMGFCDCAGAEFDNGACTVVEVLLDSIIGSSMVQCVMRQWLWTSSHCPHFRKDLETFESGLSAI